MDKNNSMYSVNEYLMIVEFLAVSSFIGSWACVMAVKFVQKLSSLCNGSQDHEMAVEFM